MKPTALLQLMEKFKAGEAGESSEVVTVRLAGREVLAEQEPFVQSEIAAARKVLSRLLATSSRCSNPSEPINYKIKKLTIYE